MRVPFVDLKRMHDPVREELHRVAAEVIDSGRYVGGEQVSRFEQEMSATLNGQEVCGVSCATMGLFSALRACGVGPGDEVITTVHTAIATAEAISLTGARAVFCDLEPGYFFLSAGEAERKITSRTRAIIPVHLYGQPADMDSILDVAARHNLLVIEDCAQAQGAVHRGRPVGTMGDLAVFSFFPSKNLGGFGDGGAVTGRDPALMKRVRMFRDHGRESKYIHEMEGVNSRLDAIQAALLRVLLPGLDAWNAHRRGAADWYAEEMASLPEVTLPKVLPETLPVYHLYVILVPDRDALRRFLEENGVGTGIHYPRPLNLQPAYARLNQGEGFFPRAEYACRHMLSLPMHSAITREEVRYVCDMVRRFFESRPGAEGEG